MGWIVWMADHQDIWQAQVAQEQEAVAPPETQPARGSKRKADELAPHEMQPISPEVVNQILLLLNDAPGHAKLRFISSKFRVKKQQLADFGFTFSAHGKDCLVGMPGQYPPLPPEPQGPT